MARRAPAPGSFLARCVEAWRSYVIELGHLTSFVWLCIFPIAGSLLLAILFNGVAEGSELLAIQRTSDTGGHGFLTVLAATFGVCAMAVASGLAVRREGKQPGSGDLIPCWIVIVVTTAVAPAFLSYVAPSISISIGLGWLIALYTLLFFALPIAGQRWKGVIARVRSGLLPGNGLPIAAAVLLTLGAAVTVAVIGNPVRFPTALATIAVVCIGVGFWALAATVLLVVVPRRFNWPTLTIVAIAVVAFFERSNDDRVIRVCQAWDPPCTAGVTEPAPGDIHSPIALNRKSVENWMAHVCPHLGRPCPMIFAAGEGGGLRAAYWTAGVLSALNVSTNGAFYRHLFALSTVSGSSLGATAFVWLNQNDANPGTFDNCAKLDPDDSNPKKFTDCEHRLLDFIDQDYLSPSIAALLFPEGLQRFWPRPIPQFDRARAFEAALESSWQNLFGGSPSISNDFLGIYAGKNGPYMPALFLNSTNVELGKRFIISDLLPHFRNDSYYAYDANAAYHITKLPVSTAVHLTARFPVVSPAGVLESHVESAGTGNVATLPGGRLVDGGYFENTGVTTLADVVGSVKYALRNSNRRDDARIYVLLILNNPQPPEAYKQGANIPSLPDRPRDPPYAAGSAAEQKTTPWSDYLSPIEGLFATQGARSFSDRYRLLQAAARELCASTTPSDLAASGPQALQAYMPGESKIVSVPKRCTGYWEISYARIAAPNASATPAASAAALKGTDYIKPALGWVLSDTSTKGMQDAAQSIDTAIPGQPVTTLKAALSASDAP